MQTENQQTLKALLEVVNTKGHIADFVQAFKFAVETLNKMKAATGAELSQLRITFDQAIKDLNDKQLKDLTGIKGPILSQIATALKEQQDGLNYMRDWVRNIPQAKTPVKGVDYFDGQDADEQAIIQAVLAQMPKQELPDSYDDTELQAKIDEHTKAIEELKSKGNTPGWGAHPIQVFDSSGTLIDEVTRNIKFTGATTTRSPDGVVTVAISAGGVNSIYGEDLTPQGVGTSYTLAHTPTTGTVRLYRGGSYQQVGAGKDYIISGAVITLSTVTQSGEIVIADYNY